jgi:hypothetical protein
VELWYAKHALRFVKIGEELLVIGISREVGGTLRVKRKPLIVETLMLHEVFDIFSLSNIEKNAEDLGIFFAQDAMIRGHVIFEQDF